MASLAALTTLNKARELEERKAVERKKSILVLILKFLSDSGYIDSHEQLSKEANIKKASLSMFSLVSVVDTTDIVLLSLAAPI